MSVEIFTTEEFEGVLSEIAQDLEITWFQDGIRAGEYHYHFVVDDELGVGIEVRSSIGRDGKSAASGKDSIRVWFADEDGKPLGSKAKSWTTRVVGWQSRLMSLVADLTTVARKVRRCPDCGKVPGIFLVKKDSPNKGRWFSRCQQHNHFTWLSDRLATHKPKQQDAPACPKCGAYMLKRHRRSDNASFWGCNRYPDCKGTRSCDDISNSVVETKDGSAQQDREFIPSKYQLAVFDFVENGDGHCVVEAVAGSGKTTTVVKALKFTNPDSDVAFVAFNRHIAKELARRAPRHVKVSTLHSLGYAACRQAYGKVLAEPDKVQKILESIMDKFVHGNKFSVIRRLVSLVKANLADIIDEDLDHLAGRYGVVLNGDRDVIFNAVRRVVKISYEQRKVVIDYDDMCWLPVVDSHVSQLFDFLFVDEAQDLNVNQIQLVLQHLKPGGRVVAVGDRNQSLYGFRGADVDAIPNLIKTLGAKILPLSITYRCPKSHVELAQRLVPDIQPADWAKEGIVRDVPEGVMIAEASDGDMVLCRTNAPLVAPAFTLIRNGTKAVIRGRDIGKGLQVLVRKMKADSMLSLMTKLAEYKSREVSKLLAANKTSMAQVVGDKVDTIIALADGVETITGLTFRIEQVFSDDVEGVVFSSVHRAKGLEAERVYILRQDLMPHPMAKQPWEQVQEKNIQYVAYTRSKHELVFV